MGGGGWVETQVRETQKGSSKEKYCEMFPNHYLVLGKGYQQELQFIFTLIYPLHAVTYIHLKSAPKLPHRHLVILWETKLGTEDSVKTFPTERK